MPFIATAATHNNFISKLQKTVTTRLSVPYNVKLSFLEKKGLPSLGDWQNVTSLLADPQI